MFIALFNSNLDTTMETLLKAPAARALLRREWLNGLYTTEAYFVATMAANTILAGLNTVALVLPLYLLVGFSAELDKAAVFFGALAIMTIIGMCVGTTIGCASSDMDEARKMLLPIIAPRPYSPVDDSDQAAKCAALAVVFSRTPKQAAPRSMPVVAVATYQQFDPLPVVATLGVTQPQICRVTTNLPRSREFAT